MQKAKDNPSFQHLYESAVGTLEQLKDWAEEHQLAYIHPDRTVREKKIAENQTVLMKKGLEESAKLAEMRPAPFLENHEGNGVSKELAMEQPQDPAKIAVWLTGIEEKTRHLNRSYPDLIIPFLSTVISNLEMPEDQSPWLKMSEQDRRKSLQVMTVLSEQLSKNAFQQRQRFSLEVQNSGARLLLIAQALAQSLDPKNILSGFKPCLKGYLKLTPSPYFQCHPYSAWQQREEILAFMQDGDSQEKKEAWKFRNKEKLSFDQTADGALAEALLNAYPAINRTLDDELKKIRHRKDLESFRSLVPGQLLLAELLNTKIHENIDRRLDLQDEAIIPLSNLAQIAMHVHLLSDSHAKYQEGYENTVAFRDGCNFDLTYAKINKIGTDINTEAQSKLRISARQRNLFPKEKWKENQNQVMQGLAKNEEEIDDLMFPFEESASETTLMGVQLMSRLKSRLADFDNSSVRAVLEPYFFKIHVARDGTESLPIVEEMSEYPHVFDEQLQEFLKAADIFTKNLGQAKINEQYACILNYSIRLFSMAQSIPCLPVLDTLGKYFEQVEARLKSALENLNERQHPQQSADLQLFLLKLLEIKSSEKIEWTNYIKWGGKLQEHLEQKQAVIEPAAQLWWNEMRLRMSKCFQDLKISDPRAAREIIPEENFDIMAMAHGTGKWQPIPLNVVRHPEFIRLFADRVHFWKVDEENQRITFSDQSTGKYQLSNSADFPQNFQRWIEGSWYKYIPDAEVVNHLHVPKAIRQESIWWLHPAGDNLKAKGYFRNQPDSLWMEREKEGPIIFKEGPAKGMRLELVENDVQSLSPLELNTGAFGEHYYAYNARYLVDHLIDNRELIVFPHLRMPHGGPLIFERHGHDFYEKGNAEKQLGECLFAPCLYEKDDGLKHQSTALKLYGIQIKKRIKEALRHEEESSILVPLQRHVSDPHSHVVHALVQKTGPESPSLLYSIDVIEIKTNSQGLCPESPRENLFAAYLSLIGKEYQEAARFLKKIRPNYRLDVQDRQILKWLIDSKEDAQDHSAAAAAIKLLAYKIWGEQALPLNGEINPKELPFLSLEAVFHYLNHPASVPNILKPSADLEAWIINQGFVHFPPSNDHQKLWNDRKEGLSNKQKIVQVFDLPDPDNQSLISKWNDPFVSEQDMAFDIPAALADGIQQPAEQALLPGKPYPMGAFGYHYQKFLMNEMSDQEKWELIYALETVEMPQFLKASLKLACQKGKDANPLPKLDQKLRQQNSHLLQEWFKALLSPLPVRIHEQAIDEERLDLPDLQEEPIRQAEDNKKFAQKISGIYEENRPSPYELIKVLQADFAHDAVPVDPLVEGDCPFDEKEGTDQSFKNEIKIYQKEWNKGVALHNEQHRFPVPDLDKIKDLDRILLLYSNTVKKEGLQNQILRIVNRRPIGPGFSAGTAA